jgi:anaerobic nitric oxide reductase flavorubredoxin
MGNIQLAEGIYWVGAIDWNLRNFHGYSTHTGATYNAYLIVDEKITLIDTVKAPFYDEMATRIRQIVPLEDIDYVISNHVEMDHSGSLPTVMKEAKKAKLITTEKFGENGLKKFYQTEWPLMPVKEGSELNIGKRKLVFVPIPMLHWPDSMVTYSPQDEILFSNDAFGQHLATSQRFDDELGLDIIMPEATKYYANILMPFSDLIIKAVEKLGGLKIGMIAPSHGIIWRSQIEKIIEAYANWGRGITENKALVIYDTMWGSTAKMARLLAEAIACEGVEVKLYNLTESDKSDIVAEVLNAKAILVGSPTLNNGMFPSVAEFLCYIKGLRPKGKIGAAFGSHGWAGGAVKAIEQELHLAGVELINSNLAFKFTPNEDEIRKCIDFGKAMAMRIKETLV